jgi:hypothetical protein
MVLCTAPDTAMLGESRRLLGNEDWLQFAFEFAVDEGCESQQLRLVSAEGFRVDEATDGVIWFDELVITRIEVMSPAERARAEARQAAMERASGGAEAETQDAQDTQ